MTGRRQPPPWLDLSQPLSDRARPSRCPRCQALVLYALVGNPAGINVRADPVPLDIPAEITARRAGRNTYCLKISALAPARLVHRGPEHVASGNCTHPVVADHHCTRPAAEPDLPPATDTDRLF